VKAFIYGHTHDWKVTQDASGIHLINLPPVAYVFKEGKPSGWVEAELERSGMTLELRCVPATHPDQDQRLRLKWRR
jgi:3',5'-cyclic-AMP phosphodiesterase